MVLASAAVLIVTKTNLVPLVKEQWSMQSYEAVESEQSESAINTISLQDIKVDNEAVSAPPTSARSRSPTRTQAFQ